MRKVVVITGASSGIGLSAARLFLRKGCRVYGVARKPFEGEFECFSADVTDTAAMDNIFREIYAREGRIDVLINNAGFGIAGAMEEATPEAVARIVEVNLTSLCVLCGKIVPYMKASGGRIVNISSVGGIMPLRYQAMYSATKAGVEVFSRALANELKPYKIFVTAVLPGDTKTEFTAARVCEGNDLRAKRSVEKMARDEQRGKSPESVAKVIYRSANKRRPPLRVAVGFVSKLELFLARIVPVRFVNFIIRKMYC